MEKIIAVIIIVFGGAMIFSSIKDHDWMFAGRKAQRTVNMIGRNGARILYSIFGIVLIFISIGIMLR